MTSQSSSFQAVQVSDNVHWVGAVDWHVRDFHGYLTQRGSTYNAYLVTADRITLVDTVKKPFFPEMMARIASVVDPKTITNLVSDHSEMDHSGSIPDAIAAIEPETVYASPRGAEALEQHFHTGREIRTLTDGDTLDLGDMAMTFLETPMIHWPDSMVGFLAGDNVLFSNDGFGMHLASGPRFADEIDPAVLRYEAAKYYANILTPLSPLIKKLLARVRDMDLPIRIIAPDHGPIWRKDIDTMVGWYGAWTDRKPGRKVVVVYDTMWESTAKMARVISDGVAQSGVEVRLLPLSSSHRSDVVTELLDAGALLMGCSTLNNTLLPRVADLLCYLKGLKIPGLIGAAFGSYGWSGQAPGEIESALKAMKVDILAEPLKLKYVPDAEGLAACRAFGQMVAGKVKDL